MDGAVNLMTFEECWKFVNRYGSIVQEKSELEYIFNLIKGCSSYLEVGSAEGSSLYTFAHALDNPVITYVDYAEPHTTPKRNEVLSALYRDLGITVRQVHGNSHDHAVVYAACSQFYDVVFIDAGHQFEDVIADAMSYGNFARKYLLFHDVQLPEVKRAFDWYCQQQGFKKVSTFIKSQSYGFGIVDLT